jgi:hypothetical protein
MSISFPLVFMSKPLKCHLPLIQKNAVGGGKRLVTASKDDEIQAIAWEQHGLRSGLIGIENDPESTEYQLKLERNHSCNNHSRRPYQGDDFSSIIAAQTSCFPAPGPGAIP